MIKYIFATALIALTFSSCVVSKKKYLGLQTELENSKKQHDESLAKLTNPVKTIGCVWIVN